MRLKTILEKSILKENEDSKVTISKRERNNFKDMLQDSVGKTAVWTTADNNYVRTPKYVQIEEVFQNFVLVRQQCHSLQGTMSYVRYGIDYSSLYAGHDIIELLE